MKIKFPKNLGLKILFPKPDFGLIYTPHIPVVSMVTRSKRQVLDFLRGCCWMLGMVALMLLIEWIFGGK